MDQVIEYIFKQGLGYVLFLGAMLLWGQTAHLLLQEKDKRAQDIKDLTTVFTGTAKDLLNGNAALQKTLDGVVAILQNQK